MTVYNNILKRTFRYGIKLLGELFFTRKKLASYNAEFWHSEFKKNNFRTLVIAMFLFIEQLLYGFFFSRQGSAEQIIFFFTAFFMVIYVLSSFMFTRHRPERITVFHRIYSTSIVWFGMAIACHRFLIKDFTDFHLPTVYLAVIYGGAVIYYMSYRESLFIYSSFAVISIYLTPLFHPGITGNVYMADITSNAMIACFIACLNYSGFMKDFLNKKTIEEKNLILIENNRHIADMNSRLLNMSMKDPLTDLYNRRKIDSVLEAEINRTCDAIYDFSIIILDLDNFKDINDIYGHTAGDETLRDVSRLLLKNLRSRDICARWGGEEFIIVCPGNDLNHAEDLAERLREKIANYYFPTVGKVNASFGVASYREFNDIEELIKNADSRLYAAKRSGRNRVVSA